MEDFSREAGLKIERAEIMVIDRTNNRNQITKINNVITINQFAYLGYLITKRRRSAIPKNVMAKLTTILISDEITIGTKIMFGQMIRLPHFLICISRKLLF